MAAAADADQRNIGGKSADMASRKINFVVKQEILYPRAGYQPATAEDFTQPAH
jgi:hypothetical protein